MQLKEYFLGKQEYDEIPVIIAGDFNQPFHNSKYDCKEPDTRTWAINQMFSGIYAYKVPLDSDDGDSKVWTYWRGHAEDQDGKEYTEVDAFFVNEWAVASIDGHARAFKPIDKERKDHRPIQLEIDMKVMTKVASMVVSHLESKIIHRVS